MNNDLSEEEMRLALFGPQNDSAPEPAPKEPEPVISWPEPVSKTPPVQKAHSPKLRVTLHVTKEFEGDVEVFIHEANTLSTLVAELEAKNAAKKKKFKYFEVISVKSI